MSEEQAKEEQVQTAEQPKAEPAAEASAPKKADEEAKENVIDADIDESLESNDELVEPAIKKEEIAKDEEEIGKKAAPSREFSSNVEEWVPKTAVGKKVKNGEITDIDQILDDGERILEQEIIDILLPDLESDLLLIGQSKGKFGGGQRRVFKQTQKKTREGNKPKFATCAIVGDKNGHIGLGFGKAKETVPAREKAIRRAKLNLIKIRRGSGSWENTTPEQNSIPFAVESKCGSVKIKFMPAPKGKGLVTEKECSKILALAGIHDIFSKSRGHTATKINVVKACFDALKQLTKIKVSPEHIKKLGISSESQEIDIEQSVQPMKQPVEEGAQQNE